MSLNEKQARFTYKIAKLIVCVNEEHDMQLIGSELFRTKEQAEWNVEHGVGILNSLHRKKLALDMYVFKDGKLSWDVADYAIVGDIWKTMDPDARWGGDFAHRDVYHFSFEHGGVK